MQNLADPPWARMRAAETRMIAALERQPTTFFRPLITDLWGDLSGWFQATRHDPDESRRIADLAVAVMADYATMVPADVNVLCKPETGWNVLSDQVALQLAELIRRDKAAVLERHAGIVALAAERAARGARLAALNRADRDRAISADREAAPARLLAKLRAAGINLSVEKDTITAPSGCAISAADRDLVVVHKAALRKLLAAEAAAARPMVVA